MTTSSKATLIGFGAVILWSSIVGLIKEVTHSFGPLFGSALMYSIAFLFLLSTIGWVPLRKFPRKYLIWGGLLMVSYELCLSLSIAYSQNSKQAIEIGMVNYLWPSFTLVSTILFTDRKSSWLIFPGIALSMLGIVWVLGGDAGFNPAQMLHNISINPLSYGLAFLGACLWSAYCVATIKISKGTNGITFFFMLTAVILWIKYLLTGENTIPLVSVSSVLYLILVAAAMGFGYAAWNIGIIKGNVTILTGASYLIPIFSSALSSALLATALGFSFWQGSSMVCAGSILCWLSTKTSKKTLKQPV
ncbi:aromatic amino acid DMT transporter YddG [Flavobacterium sp. 17A]|uniref:Aromatic amino acid DMT transporter YddG n=1 Tax=Flavobacterium potami TaxID=2872310 RepID=A0A9X1HBL4_9FLAO|nr:aromatic amino acid DMT transporter YddG [Flavobacterium potami]MBZ4035427.1 aromatic amino acid DMT transporter YddG [Flavobacterium potami]